VVSATGSRASKYRACIALHFMTGISKARFLSFFLEYIDAPQWSGMVVPLPERIDGVELLVGSVPDDFIHSWGAFALVFRHSSDGKGFAALPSGLRGEASLSPGPLSFPELP
jgi:hypothetical protein